MAKLVVIAGPMFSAKSDRLVDLLKPQEYAEQKVLGLVPKIGNRTENNAISSRSKNEKGDFTINERFPAIAVADKEEMVEVLKKNEFDALGLDEVQFFPDNIVEVIASLLDPSSKEIKGYTKDLEIYAAGLDMDAWRKPFGPMPHLMAMADKVIKTSTICFCCKRKEPRAVYTQKMGGSSERIEVGNSETYQARCRDCHFIPK